MTYRAAICYSSDDVHRQGGVRLTGPEHAALSDEAILAEARAEMRRAGLSDEESEIEIRNWTEE